MNKKESMKIFFISKIVIFSIITIEMFIAPIFSFGEEVSTLEKRYNLQSTYSKASINYEAKLKKNPNDALLHFESAIHFYAIGDKKKAIETLQKAKALYLSEGNKDAVSGVETLLGTLNVDVALEQINSRLDELSIKLDKITDILEKK